MAVGRPLRGNRRQDLENRSMMTKTQVLPSEAGRSVMKSTPRCGQGRLETGNGRVCLMEMAQSEQPCTNPLTSLAILGHQKWSFSNERVPLAPGWPVSRDVYTEWISGVRHALVMYCKPGGQPGGAGRRRCQIRDSTGWGWQWVPLEWWLLVPHRPLLENRNGKEHPLPHSWDLDDRRW